MPHRNSQESSLFFQKLPPEIRLDIYDHPFGSTRLSFGKRPARIAGKMGNVHLRPAPNSLSLLRVCRRVTDEIGDSWLGQVLFSFEDPKTMLDKLADLDPQALAKLRHMRYLSDDMLTFKIRVDDGQHTGWRFRLDNVLKLLPGLRLDRLTVVGGPGAQFGYRALDPLINHSDGWKELYYVSYNSVMLGFGKSDRLFGKYEWGGVLRAPQPSTWNQVLTSRDGPTASIAEPGKESQYGIESDATLMTPGEKQKELLVVARRGKDVDYAVNEASPLLQYDIRRYWPGMKWGQIRYMAIDWFFEEMCQEADFNEDDEDDEELRQELTLLYAPPLRRHDRSPINDAAVRTEVDERGYPIKVDTYKHADDYEWTPYHTDSGLD
ncbi:hypothetical protein FJTKL_00745 [Diaporthe vaccinii]|uniref:F-box domain-containing protein n=1 Tax=Diaporthe vaccinii TaxID=105482 RepID=A0ABR4E2B9_9PEZI